MYHSIVMVLLIWENWFLFASCNATKFMLFLARVSFGWYTMPIFMRSKVGVLFVKLNALVKLQGKFYPCK